MAASTATEHGARVLGLGNEILADDAFGILVAREVERRYPGAEIVCSSASGFDLLDNLLDVERLLVVDTVITGDCPPGTLRMFPARGIEPMAGGSPHFVGLAEVLCVAAALGMALPREVAVLAVEAAECST
ncbi:MAG TPA: hydrogenase maturation protease, partial [Bryobacteraceae bacterium]|nr:hydrogenase maturation protease [Bryobacteraceae bacterium]